MNKQEATKLLALIKLSYPNAYRDMDDVSKKATVNMWWNSFSSTPYPVMEIAFDAFRRKSKYPPTVAEMIESLRSTYYSAMEDYNVAKLMGNTDLMAKCRYLMDNTKAYRESDRQRLCYDAIPMQLLEASAPELPEGMD